MEDTATSVTPWAAWIEFIRPMPAEDLLTETLRCGVCGTFGWRPSVLNCCHRVVVCAGCREGGHSPAVGADQAATPKRPAVVLAECPHCHFRRPTVAPPSGGDMVIARVLADYPVRCRICGTSSTASGMIVDHPWCDGAACGRALFDAHASGQCPGDAAPPCTAANCALAAAIGPWLRDARAPWHGAADAFIVEIWLPGLIRKHKTYWTTLSFRTMVRCVGKPTLFRLWMRAITSTVDTIDVAAVVGVFRVMEWTPSQCREFLSTFQPSQYQRIVLHDMLRRKSDGHFRSIL